MKHIKLNDGHKIPARGFGTYKSTEEEGVQSVKNALQSGYRLLDTATVYRNEEAVGKGIIESGIPREEIIVTSKLWRVDLGYQQAKIAFEESIKKLQLDYLDLYLIHWPANAKNYTDWKKANADAWKMMEELQAEGKIKSIGVSNFLPEHLEALLETAKVIPAVNQIEFHPGFWQEETSSFSKKLGITVESWSPFARGKVLDNDVLKEIAKAHNKSVAQICLRWVLQHDAIVIPKSKTKGRIEENLHIFDFNLSGDEMIKINQLPEMGFSGESPNHWPDRIN